MSVSTDRRATACATALARKAGKLFQAIVDCHRRRIRAAFRGGAVDVDGCVERARTRYRGYASGLVECGSCVDPDGIAAAILRDGTRAARASYPAGDRPIEGGSAGFVPRSRPVLRCEEKLVGLGGLLVRGALACRTRAVRARDLRPIPLCDSRALYRGGKGLRHCLSWVLGSREVMLHYTRNAVERASEALFCAGMPL